MQNVAAKLITRTLSQDGNCVLVPGFAGSVESGACMTPSIALSHKSSIVALISGAYNPLDD